MTADPAVASPAAVIAAIRAVVPARIAVAGGDVGTATSSPWPEEDAAIARAVAKRRREFVAGRQYARAAMAQLGVAPMALPVLPSRAPAWPRGFTGSISHSQAVCVAVVAADADFIGVGIDVELATALPRELHATVLHASELAPVPTVAGGIDEAKMLFAVKEAFFKLYHPLTGHFLDFLDVDVRLDAVGGAFSLALRDGPPSVRGQRLFAGACGRAGDYCFAFVGLRGAGNPPR